MSSEQALVVAGKVAGTTWQVVALILVWTAALASLLYLLPTAIAFSRTHKDTLPVFLVNLFLGWTLVGWVVSLVWAVKSTKR